MSSSPTGTLPPRSTAWATIGTSVLKIPKPTRLTLRKSALRIANIFSTSAPAPQGMPRQICTSGGSSISLSSIQLAGKPQVAKIEHLKFQFAPMIPEALPKC